MKHIITASITDHSNQYPPLMGLPELRQAVARHSEKFNQLPVSWESETLITIGATEAMASVFLGLLNTGDEVIPPPQSQGTVPLIRVLIRAHRHRTLAHSRTWEEWDTCGVKEFGGYYRSLWYPIHTAVLSAICLSRVAEGHVLCLPPFPPRPSFA